MHQRYFAPRARRLLDRERDLQRTIGKLLTEFARMVEKDLAR